MYAAIRTIIIPSNMYLSLPFTKPCSFKLLRSVKHIILPDKRTNNFSILILTVFNKLKQWRKCNLTINAISDFCNLNHLSALIP